MVNHGIYTDTLWSVPVTFASPLPAGDYVAEVIGRGAVAFRFRSSGAAANEGVLDMSNASAGIMVFVASRAQHAAVVAGLYRLHIKRTDGDRWQATGRMQVARPGGPTSFIDIDHAPDGATAKVPSRYQIDITSHPQYWGQIEGSLASQSDLSAALAALKPTLTDGNKGSIAVIGGRMRLSSTYDAPGDGVADDAAVLNTILAEGGPSTRVYLDRGKTFHCRQQIVLPANAHIIGDGTQTFVMDMAAFTRDVFDSNFYHPAASLFTFDGGGNIRLHDFAIRPSVHDAQGRMRLAVASITKAAGQNVRVEYVGADVLANNQRVTIYGTTGANEVNADLLAGQANPRQYLVTGLDAATNSFFLADTQSVVLTPYVSGGFIEPKRILFPVSGKLAKRVEITDLEVYGFTAGAAVALNGCDEIEFRPRVRDWYTNFVWQTASEAQQTAMTVDAARPSVGGEYIGSNDVRMAGGYVKRLLKGEAAHYSQDAPTSRRRQSDGGNINGTATYLSNGALPTRFISVCDVDFDEVEEAVDCFGKEVVITGNRAQRSGFKIMHGGSEVTIAENHVKRSGQRNLILAHAAAVTDAPGSKIILDANTFGGVDVADPGASLLCCIELANSDIAAGALAPREIISRGNIYDPGLAGRWAIANQTDNAETDFSSDGDLFVKRGADGYIRNGYQRQAGIAAISPTNPCMVTLIEGVDPTILAMFTVGRYLYLSGVGGSGLAAGYYRVGSVLSGRQFQLNTLANQPVDGSTLNAYAGGGVVQFGSRFEIRNPAHKTRAKLAMLENFVMGPGVLSATLPFKAAVFDHGNELDAAGNGLRVRLPGTYRITGRSSTSGATPMTASEETVFKLNVSGIGDVASNSHIIRDTEAVTYVTETVVQCDENDLITAILAFTANASGVTIRGSHIHTSLTVEMI